MLNQREYKQRKISFLWINILWCIQKAPTGTGHKVKGSVLKKKEMGAGAREKEVPL